MERLVLLYVTLEQEIALQQLFTSRAWTFSNLGKILSEELENEILCAWKQSKEKASAAADKETNKGSLDTPDIDDIAADDCNLQQTETKAVNYTEREGEESGNVSDIAKDKLKRKAKRSNQIITEKKRRKFGVKRKEIKSNSLNLRSRSLKSDSNVRKTTEVDISQEVSDINVDDIHVKQTKCLQPTVSYQKNEKHTNVVKESSYCNNIDREHYRPETVSEKLDEIIKHEDVTDRNKSQFDSLPVDNQEAETRLLSGDVKKGFQCDKCSYRTNVRSNLNRHVREIHSGVRHRCSKCNKTFKGKHDAKMHELHAHNSSLQCKECDKMFSSVSGLRNHVKIIHKQNTLYECEHCNMKFYYKSHYLGHVNKHLNLKPFSCKTCQKPFRYKVACHLHEKTCSSENYYITHNPDGSLKEVVKSKFLCDICGLELTSKSSLKMHHYYTHSDDTTTVCSLCGKSFKGTYSLQRHMKNAHEDTGVRYRCPDCKKEFSQQQVFKQHLKIHKKEYTCFCETCGKGFLSKFKMMEHTRTHTGEKPFSCPHCQSYKAATKTNLQKHMRIHDEGRLPRQPSRKKRKQKSVLPKEKNHHDKRCDEAKSVEGSLRNVDSLVGPIYMSLQMSTDSYARTSEYVPGQGQYTDLHQVSVDDDSVRYGTQSYDHSYMVDQNISHLQDQVNFTIRNQQDSGGHIHGNFEIGNIQRNELENKERSETNIHSKDIVKGDSQNNYEMNSHSDGFYGNDSGSEQTELSQGLNILTVAMNIVNPSQY